MRRSRRFCLEYADDLGLSKSGAGVLSAAYAAGTLVAALPSGWLAAKIGFQKAMLVGLALLGVSSVVFAFAQSVALLDVARFAEGVGGACAWTGGLAWLIAAAPAERRGELIGAALAAAIFGILLGPVIGGIATVIGPEIVFCSVAVIAAVLAARVIAGRGAAAAAAFPACARSSRAIFTRPVLFAFWLVILPSMLSGLFDVLVPLRLDALGAGGIAVGAAFFGAAALESFTAPAIGQLSDRRGRMTPIRLGLIASPLAALALPLPELNHRCRARAGRRRPRDEPDLDPGDGAALRQLRGGWARPRLRDGAGQPRLGGGAGDRWLRAFGVRRCLH